MRPLDKVVLAGMIALVALRYSPDPVSPGPDPSPDVGTGMRVLWVVETRDKVPQYITNQVASKDVRLYLNSHCAKDGEHAGYRVYDPHTDVSHDPQIWKDMMAAKRASVPWLYIAKGRKVSSGVPPKDIPSLMTLLQKYGGR